MSAKINAKKIMFKNIKIISSGIKNMPEIHSWYANNIL